MKRLHHGTVKNGKPVFDDRSKFVSSFYSMEGKRFSVSVGKYEKKCSYKQHKYLRGVLYKILADDRGYTNKEMHRALKHLLGATEEINGIMVPKSMADYTMEEFEAYTLAVRVWGTNEGYYMPLPNEVEI